MKSISHIAVPEDAAEQLVMRLKEATGVAFDAHDSSYKGAYWQHKSLNGDVAEVSYNCDPMWRDGDPEEDQFFQPKFAEFAVLVWVSGTAEFVSSVESAVAGLYTGSKIIESTVASLGVQADAASLRRLSITLNGMRTIVIDCSDVSCESEFWQTYLDVTQPEGAEYFGCNLDAFNDAITAGGPGWPGECELRFIHMSHVHSFRGGAFYRVLQRIASDATNVRIQLEALPLLEKPWWRIW